MLVVSDLFCLQSFVFKQLQYLHLQYSFWVRAGASHCILKKKRKASIVIYETLLPGAKYLWQYSTQTGQAEIASPG